MTSDLLPWEGSKDLWLLDGKVCAQHDVVAVPVCLPGTSSGSWFVLNKGAERDVTAVVGHEMYVLRISMSYNNYPSLSRQLCGSKAGYLRCFSCKLNTYIIGRAAGPAAHLEFWKVPLALSENCFAKAHSIKV